MSVSRNVNIQNVITNIQSIIRTERGLYAELDNVNNSSGSNDFKVKKQKEISDKITESIQLRVSLYDQINSEIKIMADSSEAMSKATVQQLTMLDVLEKQIAYTNQQSSSLLGNNDTQKRLIQINTFYGKNYEAQTSLFKTIIITCVPLLILIIVKTRGILPPSISNTLIGVYIAVALIIIIRKWWDINTRDNMNFDEYNWKYEDPSTSAPSIWQYNKDNLHLASPFANLMQNLGICVGSTCCGDGMQYSDTKLKCINVGKKTRETFTSGKLTGVQLGETDDKDKKPNEIEPYNESVSTASYF